MAILAIILLSLWIILFTGIWFSPSSLRLQDGWRQWYLVGFLAQLTLFAYAAAIPFLNLNRYSRSLLALREDDPAGLEQAIELNVRFWKQCSYLMWGAAWLLTYLIGGSIIGTIFGGK